MLTILALAVIQSLYDFAGWYGIIQHYLKVDETAWQARLFRVVKEILDFPVTFFIIYYKLHFGWPVIAAFYIVKWFHLCDSFYNIWEFILTNKPTVEWGYWRWWTPLGLLRTSFLSKQPVIRGYTELDYRFRMGHWDPACKPYELLTMFSRGMVNIKESWIQAAVGLVLAFIILQFINF